jgi:hypothetical protein
MDDAVPVWGTVVHVLASDHGRKPKAIIESSLVCGGRLGARMKKELERAKISVMLHRQGGEHDT